MRIAILGRGGSGKSTLARQLGLPHIELDKLLWGADLTPQPLDWESIVSGEEWVIDGDLGAYDNLAPRVARADAVVVLDFPLWLCAWRALRRGHENWEFWRWVIGYLAVTYLKYLTKYPQKNYTTYDTPKTYLRR